MLLKLCMICAAFEGQPVTLEDGRVVDSASLPTGAIRAQPVNLTAEALTQTMQLTESAQAHPVTFSEASLAGSQRSARRSGTAAGHPVTFSGGSIMDSGPGAFSQQQEAVEYHPVVVTDPDHLSEEALQGSISLLYYP